MSLFELVLSEGLIPMVAAGVGAWLSVRYMPLKAKKDEWFWRNRRRSKTYLFTTLGKINFMTLHTLLDHHKDEYSMAGKTLKETETEAMTLIEKLHGNAGVMQPFLSARNKEILKEFLMGSKAVLDNAKQTWGLLDRNEPSAEYDHTLTTVSAIHDVSQSALDQLKKPYQPKDAGWLGEINWPWKKDNDISQ